MKYVFNKSLLLRIIIIIILISILLYKVDFGALIKHMNRNIFFSILLVQPFMILNLSFIAIRHAALVRTPAAPFFPTFKAIILSAGLNNILPARISEIFKITYLWEREKIPVSAGFSGIVLGRIIDLVILGILVMTNISIIMEGHYFLIFFLLTIVCLMLLLPYYENKIISLTSWMPLINNFIKNILRHTSNRVRSGVIYKALIYSVISWGMFLITVLLLLSFSGRIDVSILDSLKVLIAVVIGSAIPILPGGFVTYETAGTLVSKSFGYATEEALAIIFSLHISQIIFSTTYAFIILITERIGISSMVREAIKITRKNTK